MDQLDVEKFKEQVGYDRDLLIEIIDLFFSESAAQLTQMHEALERRDYDTLSRIAHTMKGSFGSLHAEPARLHAHDLEIAARQHDEQTCTRLGAALDGDLASLTPQLSSLRDSPDAI
jgi:HPt (histidine-containing phosphotransfer) domain-containing protein